MPFLYVEFGTPHSTAVLFLCSIWGQSNVIDLSLSVCFSVCLSTVISHKTTRPHFTTFSVLVICGRGSVLLWWQCNMFCTFGFVGHVMFSHRPNRVNGRESKYVCSSSPGGGTGGNVCRIQLYLFTFGIEKLTRLDRPVLVTSYLPKRALKDCVPVTMSICVCDKWCVIFNNSLWQFVVTIYVSGESRIHCIDLWSTLNVVWPIPLPHILVA